MKILVCDDEKEIVDAIEIYLLNEGYEVAKAYDGIQAVKCLEREEVHLVIMDIMMPNLDGFSAVKEIKKTKPNISIHISIYIDICIIL